MTRNMGTLDRSIRILIALVIAACYVLGRLSGTLAIFLLIVAAVFSFTSLTGWCPAYLPFGISTRRPPSDG